MRGARDHRDQVRAVLAVPCRSPGGSRTAAAPGRRLPRLQPRSLPGQRGFGRRCSDGRAGHAAERHAGLADRAVAPAASVTTTVTTPKSPLRRRTLGTTTRPRPAGREPISVRSSSGSSAVVKWVMKKSAAAMVRAPLERDLELPVEATKTTGSSAAGSAWATLPPIVPRLRMARGRSA